MKGYLWYLSAGSAWLATDLTPKDLEESLAVALK
jgi:hypothetical protein